MEEIISYGCFRCRELAPHKNRGMEITYIAKGHLEWMVEGKSETVPAGSIFFTLPWQIHGSTEPCETDNTIYHLLFHLAHDYTIPRNEFAFRRSLGFDPAETRGISRTLCRAQRHGYRATSALRWLMPRLMSELQSPHTHSESQARNYLRATIVELARLAGGEPIDTEARTPTERRVQHLLDTAQKQCEQPWTLATMASQCGIQRSRLNTIIQHLSGYTPMEFIARARIERAKALLREGNQKIVDIAFECGFASSQYFANQFRRAVGLSPTRYRAQRREHGAKTGPQPENVAFRSETEERNRVRTFSAGNRN